MLFMVESIANAGNNTISNKDKKIAIASIDEKLAQFK